MLAKMEARAALISKRHPVYGMNQAQLEKVLWQVIEKELTTHCSSPHTDPLNVFAFIVGAPLNDTVFMCTGCELQPLLPHHTFAVAHAPKDGVTMMVNFYSTID
jgi:hypothetical protein